MSYDTGSEAEEEQEVKQQEESKDNIHGKRQEAEQQEESKDNKDTTPADIDLEGGNIIGDEEHDQKE